MGYGPTLAHTTSQQPDTIDRGCGRNIPTTWAVAHTHPQAERWADTNLQRAGYLTFLPLYAARRRDRATPTLFHVVQRPLFTGYVFVAIGKGDPWVPARYAPGVHTLLMANNKPQNVDAGVISALQATEASRRSIPAQTAQWAPGAPVVVARGIFAGLPAAVLESAKSDCTVAVMFLGALRTVPMPIEYLVARSN